MLDRMISGAGAVTDGADRAVRSLTSRAAGSPVASRPGSVLVAVLLFILAGLFLLAGVEATDPSVPIVLDPSVVARADDLGGRTYATMHGSLLTDWVETFEDTNDNGIEDADEHGVAWFYWLLDPGLRRGVTVRSTRAPAELFRWEGTGVVIADPGYHDDNDPWFDHEVAAAGLHVDPTMIVDATHATGSAVPLDLAADLPAGGTAVRVAGARTGAYRMVCSHDTNRDTSCDEADLDRFELAVFDPATKRAVRVLLREPPEFSEASLTGILRAGERAVDDARSTPGLDFGGLDIAVSDRFVLDESVPPGSAPLAFALALGMTALGAIILAGLAGGYLIYRRSGASLPAPLTTLGPGERLPLRISGLVRTATGLEHVREAPGDLIRFVLGRPMAAAMGDESPRIDEEAAASTTLIVERTDAPHGVAVGLGELQRLSSGTVMTFRAPRPALRVVAGTGPLLLSFDSDAERDRAAAELLDESGLGHDGTRIGPA